MTPSGPRQAHSVRVRLVPWRPRWRTGRRLDPGDDLDALGGVVDDPVAGLLWGLLVLLVLPFLLAAAVGVALLGVEVLALLPVGLLLLIGRLCGLRPWVLEVTWADGEREDIPVVGVRRAWRTVRALRAQVPARERVSSGRAPGREPAPRASSAQRR